jgi:hypothetical protein
LILLPKKRKSLGLKTNSQKNIEKMLSDLKTDQASSSNLAKWVVPISQQFSNSDSTDLDFKILEENFEKVDLEPKLQRLFDKSKPVNFSKNWYSRPTLLDLQFEERFLQSQFSISADKLYE